MFWKNVIRDHQWTPLIITKLHSGYDPSSEKMGFKIFLDFFHKILPTKKTIIASAWHQQAGWPEWANFRLLGDCLLWAVFLKFTDVAHVFGLRFSTDKIKYWVWHKMGRPTFRAIFSQTHLVTLTNNLVPWNGGEGRKSWESKLCPFQPNFPSGTNT
jgi:hypothetical protein